MVNSTLPFILESRRLHGFNGSMENRLFIRPWNNLRNALLLTLLLIPAAQMPSAGAAGAQAVAVDLELILMADASGSIDFGEFQLQRRGYAAALRKQV